MNEVTHRGLVVALLGVLCLSGCGGTPGYEVSIGANARSATVSAMSFAAVTDGSGVARVVGTLLNTSAAPTRLVGVSAKAERVSVKAVLNRPIPLRPGEPVSLAQVAAIDLKADVLPEGFLIELTLEFTHSRAMVLHTPIEPRSGPYREIEVTGPPDGRVRP